MAGYKVQCCYQCFLIQNDLKIGIKSGSVGICKMGCFAAASCQASLHQDCTILQHQFYNPNHLIDNTCI